MNRKEAINVIESSEIIWARPTKEERIALSMAINALKAEEKDELHVGDEIFYKSDETDTERRGIICSIHPNVIGQQVYVLTPDEHYYWIESGWITAKGRHFGAFAEVLAALKGV